jgi:hypothetical protein
MSSTLRIGSQFILNGGISQGFVLSGEFTAYKAELPGISASTAFHMRGSLEEVGTMGLGLILYNIAPLATMCSDGRSERVP